MGMKGDTSYPGSVITVYVSLGTEQPPDVGWCVARWENGTWPPPVCPSTVALHRKYTTLTADTNVTTYGEVVSYECRPGYEIRGQPRLECTEHVTWGDPDSHPVCIRPRSCGARPLVENGRFLRSNGTRAYGEAVYRCDSGTMMVGDGKARCLPVREVTTRRLINTTAVERTTSGTATQTEAADWLIEHDLRWVYLPRCEKVCPASMTGDPGDLPMTRVYVTRCTTITTASFSGEECSYPIMFGLHANQSEAGDTMTFRGGEICVGAKVIDRKFIETRQAGDVTAVREEVVSDTTDCAAFCMPGLGGYRRLLVESSCTASYSGDVTTVMKHVAYRT